MSPEERRKWLAELKERSAKFFFGQRAEAIAERLDAEALLLEIARRFGISEERARGAERPESGETREDWRTAPSRVVAARTEGRITAEQSYEAARARRLEAGELLWERTSGEAVLGFDTSRRLWLCGEGNAIAVCLDGETGAELEQRWIPILLRPILHPDGKNVAGMAVDQSAIEVRRIEDGGIVLSTPTPGMTRSGGVYAFSPTGHALVVETAERVAVIDAAGGRLLYEAKGPRHLMARPGGWSSDGRLLALCESGPEERQWTFRVLDTNDWNVVAHAALGDPDSWFSTFVHQLQIAPSAGLLFAACSHGVLVLDLTGAAPLRALTSKRDEKVPVAISTESTAMGVAIDPPGTRLASLHADGFLRFWRIPDLELIRAYDTLPRPDSDHPPWQSPGRHEPQQLAADTACELLVTWGRDIPTACWRFPDA